MLEHVTKNSRKNILMTEAPVTTCDKNTAEATAVGSTRKASKQTILRTRSVYARDLAAHNDKQEINKTRLLSQSA